MYKGNKFLAVIPARAGSKGIPNKNITSVNGKPLIQFTIDEALMSNYLDDIIVSTDSPEIALTTEKLGIKVPYLRPSHLAQDDSKTIDTLLHVIQEQRKRGLEYDYLVLLQPTQPLRKFWHIDQAIEDLIANEQHSLASISKVKDHPILTRKINKHGILEKLLENNSTVRRQDFPDYYKVNGAIYINKVEGLNHNSSLNDNAFGFIMEKEFDLDIDDFIDLAILEVMLKS